LRGPWPGGLPRPAPPRLAVRTLTILEPTVRTLIIADQTIRTLTIRTLTIRTLTMLQRSTGPSGRAVRLDAVACEPTLTSDVQWYYGYEHPCADLRWPWVLVVSGHTPRPIPLNTPLYP
jgi:hypothetical protein